MPEIGESADLLPRFFPVREETLDARVGQRVLDQLLQDRIRHGGHVRAARQLAALDHLGNHADAAELAGLAREQEDAILVTREKTGGAKTPSEAPVISAPI